MGNPVDVPLKAGPDRALLLGSLTPLGLGCPDASRRYDQLFQLLSSLPNIHIRLPSFRYSNLSLDTMYNLYTTHIFKTLYFFCNFSLLFYT
jgi:hypothetical protein